VQALLDRLPGEAEAEPPGLPGRRGNPARGEVVAASGARTGVSQAVLPFGDQPLGFALPHGERPGDGRARGCDGRTCRPLRLPVLAGEERHGLGEARALAAAHVVDGVAPARRALPAVPFAQQRRDVEAVDAPAEGAGSRVLAAAGVGDAHEGRVRLDQPEQIDLARAGDVARVEHGILLEKQA